MCGFSSNDNNLSAIRNDHNVFQTKIENKIADLSILEEVPDDQHYAAALYAIINELLCDWDEKNHLNTLHMVHIKQNVRTKKMLDSVISLENI